MATVKKASKSGFDQEREWKIDSAMSTILRYNDLMKDQALMKDVQKKAQEQLNTVNTNLKNGGKVSKNSARSKAPVSKKATPAKKKKK